MISLDTINYELHSIQIKDAAGDALAIDAAGKIGAVVEATDLDIRDLDFATDSVDVSGSTVELGATTLAALESITVVATDLDIRDLAFATDKVDVTGSEVELGATTLAALESITVVATDLDIRNLVFATDKVDVSGSVIETVEGGYASWSVVAASVDDTAGGTQLAAAPLSGRLRVEIQNLGTQDIYIKEATGVTTSNGLKVPKGSSYEQALDDGAEIWAITPSGTADLRIAQYAA